jgi:hypothetical protein
VELLFVSTVNGAECFSAPPVPFTAAEGNFLHIGQNSRYVPGPVSAAAGYLTLVLRSSSHYNGDDHNGARKRHWCGSRQLPVKNNIQLVYIHTRRFERYFK